ncbi:hypothetical protein [Rhizobium binae]|uniref:hypothetical protein n=1 Tax=Rhizobium binae TaxID=1138190 RepID=UPI003DA882B5
MFGPLVKGAEPIALKCPQCQLPTVIAEGIETEHQVEVLAGLGAKFGQGYNFSRAITCEELASRLKLQGIRNPTAANSNEANAITALVV